MAPRRIVILCYDGMELLDVAGPANVFTAASRLLAGNPASPRHAAYEVRLVAAKAGPVVTPGGVGLHATHSFRGVRSAFDTLLIPGSMELQFDPALVRTAARLAPKADRVVGVCSGALVLADAGLLAGRRAATHWAAVDALENRGVGCAVEADAIYVRDGNVWTSAGVSAGMDLALALVEKDHGAELALDVARWLVMYLRRPGGQSQFSAALAAQRTAMPAIDELCAWMLQNLGRDLSVPVLAKQAGMSPRHFARVFAASMGQTPGRWVQRIRVDAARSALETSPRSVKSIAYECGFGQPEAMNRAFRRVLKTTPLEYRARFRC